MYGAIVLLLFPFGLMMTMLTLGAWVSWRRHKGKPEYQWVAREPGPLARYVNAIMGVAVFFAVCSTAWMLIFVLPDDASLKGAKASAAIRRSLLVGNCNLCRSFGPAHVRGLPIAADGRGIYVATPRGGIVLVPLSGIVIEAAPSTSTTRH